ncbi:MAG TPA: hypothetical protein EYO33_28610 [Phycisphaerales bacterium]|nr:hypothetical protein [Phycisphaerales bacterium]
MNIEVEQPIDNLHKLRSEIQLMGDVEPVRIIKRFESERVHPVSGLAVDLQVALVVERAIVHRHDTRLDFVGPGCVRVILRMGHRRSDADGYT